ncbi:quinolinate synthase A [Candidatus Moduliflexus flocculans]|uniref:Quinolinate synthase n=1 Tax=Candidatus Moduliflexus flocculans TaxID=1499966 RepID=A0A0S6W008_9BACT|nr:quinolinate synthase A [Candidatus Moduliflexus flocculans]
METGQTKIVEKILALKRARNAVILAHNYQLGEIQDIGDFVGDSLELSQQAAKTDADVIVFCGVHFMAETAAILSPQKTVLLPDAHAGCPMADMITADQLRAMKREHPGAAVVCYVNSSAEVKAESDICCTSANSVNVVESLKEEEVLFVPDQYLGMNTARQTAKKMIFWPGYCPTHARITPATIERMRGEFPSAKVVVHPECRPDVVALADGAFSTSGILRYASREDTRQMIVGTELGIIHRLRKEHPDKQFIPISEQAVCPHMKMITLEKVLWTLEEMSPQITVSEPIREQAISAIERMLALS